jgi:hypothetical protein
MRKINNLLIEREETTDKKISRSENISIEEI